MARSDPYVCSTFPEGASPNGSGGGLLSTELTAGRGIGVFSGRSTSGMINDGCHLAMSMA